MVRGGLGSCLFKAAPDNSDGHSCLGSIIVGLSAQLVSAMADKGAGILGPSAHGLASTQGWLLPAMSSSSVFYRVLDTHTLCELRSDTVGNTSVATCSPRRLLNRLCSGPLDRLESSEPQCGIHADEGKEGSGEAGAWSMGYMGRPELRLWRGELWGLRQDTLRR